MKKAKKNCLGIDLTQQRPLVAIAEDSEITECKTLADTPPAALLPLIPGESVISGASAHSHRRGTGFTWPPESQVPIYSNYKNGIGRIPLVCAWQKLAKRSAKSFSGILGDTAIGWRPTGEKELSCSAEKLIAESITSWKKIFSNSKAAIIMPDSLGEAAQQALIDHIDHCDAFLTPRPVAVALSWCRNNINSFNGLGEKSEEGTSIGHLVIITMAFDQWEVVPIEIKAKIFDEKLWLVPVRNRTAKGGEISRLGASFFFGLASSVVDNLQDAWHVVFGSPKGSNYSIEKIVPNKKQKEALRNCVIRGWTEKDRSNLQVLDAWKDMVWTTQSNSFDLFKEELVNLRNQQIKYLPDKAREKCLGIVIDGACAHIHITETRRLGDFVADAFKPNDVTFSDGFEAVRGAAYTAAALENGLPCYRETILPIEIHHHRRDRHGDWTNAYKLLVEGTTVRAGEEYKSKKSVTGLKIKQGEKILNFVLRRSSGNNEKVFRKVSAEIPEETQKDESVLISANLRPGQGFAKVTINSERRGVFSTSLDWRTMEDCEEPPPPNLSYLPQVSKVEYDRELWLDAENFLNAAINSLENDTYDLTEKLDLLRNHINKWPLADDIDDQRGRIPKNDPLLHYGVFPSDGDLDCLESPNLAKRFIHACEEYFSNSTRHNVRKKIMWVASWLYLACPSSILNLSRKNLKHLGGQTSDADLAVIGLCWDKKSDLTDFFAALEQIFLSEREAINNWLRASRNIVRFRDHALKPEVVPKERLDNIIEGLYVSLLKETNKSNFQKKFDNCILSLLYLLKRRRYDANFLAPESELAIKIDETLNNLITNRRERLSHRQFTIVSITLKFFRKEASYADLQGIMVEN